MLGIQLHCTFGAATLLLCFAFSTQAATNNLDETARKLLGPEAAFSVPKEGEGALAEPLGGIVTHTPGRRLQERRIEKATKLDYDDKLATAQSSQALILTPQQAAALGPEGIIRIQRLTGPVTEAIRVDKGRLYFKSIGTPQRDGVIRVMLESGELALAGTEFYVEAATNGTALVLMLDGSARLFGQALTNAPPVALKAGDRGQVAAEAAPRGQTVGPITKQLFNNTVQWCLYYPAVLFLEDFSDEFRQDPLFRESLRWYQAGAVQRAWESLPPKPSWDTDERKLYAAALLLALGDVDGTEALLAQIEIPASDHTEGETRPGNISKTPLTRPDATLAPSDGERDRVRGKRMTRSADTSALSPTSSQPTSPRPSPPVRRAERGKSGPLRDNPSGRAMSRREDTAFAASERLQRLGSALRQLIAAVKFDDAFTPPFEPQLATEWLARSYHLQASVHDPRNIAEALDAAMRAVNVTPQATNFAHGWAQLAALQFSRGHIKEAQLALTNALRLAPSNAAPYALQGFLHAAQDRRAEAEAAFKQALELNTKLGDAWLGLGLMAFHNNDPRTGLERLQIAVAHEPQRSVLRSYLGKGYYEAVTYTANPLDSLKQLFTPGDPNRAALLRRATNELHMARLLDPRDPTPDLYSALIKAQQNRINEAVRDLERSKELNDNRRLYRSGLLLDQDQAVRSANLAAIYRDVGLTDWSVREATRAVNSDYANYSAHLFLANSYDALRDPRQINLRYETPWLNELLLANLLQPAGAGALSQSISQQEYSRFFDRDRLGLFSATTYQSSGDWVQAGSHYGTVGSTSYSLDTVYRSFSGDRPNHGLEDLTVWTKIGHQVTPRDNLLLEAIYYDLESGDGSPYYDPGNARLSLRNREKQEPTLLAGYHHEWSPAHHTLFLAARLHDWQHVTDRRIGGRILSENRGSFPTVFSHDLEFEGEFETYSTELQHIWREEHHTTVVGGRIQAGEFGSEATELNPRVPGGFLVFFPDNLAQSVRPDFSRATIYGYQSVELFDSLVLTAGLTYDSLEYPVNHRSAPLSNGERNKDRLSPKAGFVWTINPRTTLRGAYTRSLGGVSFDQSFRLEPVQVAGFVQSFRGLIPESEAGSATAQEIETWGFSLDHQFPAGTYLGITGQWLESETGQAQGVFVTNNVGRLPYAFPASIDDDIDFRERTVQLTINQLVGEEWSFGGQYQFGHSELEQSFSDSRYPRSAVSAVHQQVALQALYNHRSGFFALAGATWRTQSNAGYTPDQPGDEFWQFDLAGGYRFFQRRAEFRLALLNMSDQDYRLNPLNFQAEPLRKRTLAVSLKFDL